METNQVLRFVLELQKEQAIYLDRQHRWIAALAKAIAADPELGERLRQDPFYDLGPEPSLRKIDVLTQNIDALIAQLR